MELKLYLKEKRVRVDRALEAFLPKQEGPAAEVVEAMRYSLFAGRCCTASRYSARLGSDFRSDLGTS
jgi:hypothetical protein